MIAAASVVISARETSTSVGKTEGSAQPSLSPAEVLPRFQDTAGLAELRLAPASGIASVEARAFDAYRAETRAQVRDVLESYAPTIFRQRNSLIEKEFHGELTADEKRKLAYLRWQLDQLEDATRGPALDMLKAHVARRRDLANAVKALVTKLESERPTSTTPRNRRGGRRL